MEDNVTNREPMTIEALRSCLREARGRSLALIEDLDDDLWLGPRLPIINPPRWEIGHMAWFQEYWILRHLERRAPLLPNGDALFDSAKVPHDERWSLPLPDRAGTLAYTRAVLDAIDDRLARVRELDHDERYFHLLALYHEDMHGEAFVYLRQTCGYPPPAVLSDPHAREDDAAGGGGPLSGDVEVPGGLWRLGAEPGRDGPFVFDNEQWAHEVRLSPFRISRAAVTQGEFRNFVADGGYARRDFWTDEGWQWRTASTAEHPVYWRAEPGGRWSRRRYDAWDPLEENLPIHFVNAYETDAFCRWASRRLPSEAEWECAAGPARFPWGDEPPTSAHAQLDLRADGPCEVGAHVTGDSPFGVRQMIGNVWEWTATDFSPYPGFVPGPYREYSEPWFGTHRVLRGGAFATRSRLLRRTFRNFYTPDRRDVLVGFRTCAL